MKNIFFLIQLFVFLLVSHFIPAKELEDLFCGTEKFQRAHVGICVVEIANKRVVYQRNADHYFIPASLQKIPLSVAATTFLGDDYSFRTDLEYEGNIDEEGILHGNLWVKGGGDPSLSLEVLSQWEEAMKSHNIKAIHGKIIVDASCFESCLASRYWLFEDLGNYFGAGACGLTINRNLYHITFRPGEKEGDPATILQMNPSIPNLTFYNEVKTGAPQTGDRVYIFGSEYSPIQFYRGTVPIDQPTLTVKATIPDPPAFLAHLLQERLKSTDGMAIIREQQENNSQRIKLSSHLSAPLKELIEEMNQFSINLYAEHLLKAIGKGSAQNGTVLMEKLLDHWNIPAQVKDGSGLAMNNHLTPNGFTDLLVHIHNDPLYQAVYSSIPEIGSGTLVFFPKLSKGTLKAKTGSMSQTYNLGGFLTLPSGREYAISIFCNNYPGPLKEIRDEMVAFLNQLIETD